MCRGNASRDFSAPGNKDVSNSMLEELEQIAHARLPLFEIEKCRRRSAIHRRVDFGRADSELRAERREGGKARIEAELQRDDDVLRLQ